MEGEKKRKKKAACQANSDPHTASSGRRRGQAGLGHVRGRLSSATQTAHCLPSRETNSFFQTQQGSQRVSSIHLHRRNRSFPSNEQFIENRSHLVPTSTRRYVNKFALGAGGFFSSTFSQLFLVFSLFLSSHHFKQKSSQVQTGHTSLKAASFQVGSPLPPPAGCFSALLRSPTWKRVR